MRTGSRGIGATIAAARPAAGHARGPDERRASAASERERSTRPMSRATPNPTAVMATPAMASTTKWLPVAKVERITSGPHAIPAIRSSRDRALRATAMPSATAKPACRLGTAA